MRLKNKVSETGEVLAQPVVDILSSILFEGAASQLLPGVTTTILSYRQKRSERMIRKFLEEIELRQARIEQLVALLDSECIRQFQDTYLPIILDHVYDNNQEEKITIIVDGFISLLSEKELNENVVLNYYRILADLNMLDIRVLNELRCEATIKVNKNPNVIQSRSNSYSFEGLLEKTNIKSSDLSYIVTNLEKNKLIENTQFFNYEELVDQVIKLSSDNGLINRSRTKDVDDIMSLGMPSLFILTDFGVEFIRFFYNKET